MKPLRLPLLLALLLGLLAPWSPAPATAAAYGVLTGRVVDKDGVPMADVEVNLFRQGANVAVAWSRSAADGTFTFQPANFDDAATGPYTLLVGSGWDGTTAIPTWYDGSGADGGIRGEVTGSDPNTDRAVAASAPSGVAPIVISSSPTPLGDLRVLQGAQVVFDSRDTLGNAVNTLRVTAPWGVSGRVSTRRAYPPTGVLLDAGQHTITVEASAVDPGGRQQVTLDLAVGSRTTVPITWAARYYLLDNDLTWGEWRAPLSGERPGVGTKLHSGAVFANDSSVVSGSLWPINTSFQWYRGAKPIAGATRASYKVVAADRGRKIGFRVTAAAKPGYAAATYVGPQVKVAKVTSRVRARFVGRSIKVRVRLSNGAQPTGRVALMLTSERRFPQPLVSKKLKANARGLITLRIPEPFYKTKGDTGIFFAVRFVAKRKAISVGIGRGPTADIRNGTLSQ